MSEDRSDSPINAALRSFEAAEANLEKLERLFAAMRPLVPDGLCFGSDGKYDDLCRAYADVLAALPKIDGWKPQTKPIDLNELAQWRLDAHEISEISAIISADEAVDVPARELSEYRHRLNKKRRPLVRQALSDVIAVIDAILRDLRRKYPEESDPRLNVEDPSWDYLTQHIQEIETLLGSSLSRPPRWRDLRRHLNFGQSL